MSGFSYPVGQAPGSATNDSASAGFVGEILSGTAAGVSVSNGSVVNITSVALTAGDWDVSGLVNFVPTASMTASYLAISIHTANNAMSPTLGQYAYWQVTTAIALISGGWGSGPTLVIPAFRLSLSAGATYYVNANCGFSGGTGMTASAIIRARRER